MPPIEKTSLQFLYGTAWKEERTKPLTLLAIEQGFRGIDTANQRKHYHEAAVGDAIQEAINAGIVTRNDLFLQTKFTFVSGQDHRLPYDPTTSIKEQVTQSFTSSLNHLKTEQIDAYILHGPSQPKGLGEDDWSAWRAMESIYESGRARYLGISNVSLDQLKTLLANCTIKPQYVQNRCYAVLGWDQEVRSFCLDNAIIYQGFSLLTANAKYLSHPDLVSIARRHQRPIAQIIFRFALEVGILPLTGTTNAAHMQMDLDVKDFELQSDDVKQIAGLSTALS
jgi:diketogulonate reductase-like aldo/keto reductase